MSATSSTGFWVVIGKLATGLVTVIGLVLGTQKVYRLFYPSGPKLVARCRYNSYALPPDLMKTIGDVQRAESWEDIARAIKSIYGPTNKLDRSSAMRLAEGLSAVFEAKWPSKFRYYSNPYSSFWHITVGNSGNRIAHDVVLELPSTGIALITKSDEAQTLVSITNHVRLGSIRPGDSVDVAVWSKEDIWIGSSGLRLTHAGGVSTVSLPSTFYGIRAFAADNLFELGLPIVCIVVLLFVGVIVQSGGAEQPTEERVNEQPKQQ